MCFSPISQFIKSLSLIHIQMCIRDSTKCLHPLGTGCEQVWHWLIVHENKWPTQLSSYLVHSLCFFEWPSHKISAIFELQHLSNDFFHPAFYRPLTQPLFFLFQFTKPCSHSFLDVSYTFQLFYDFILSLIHIQMCIRDRCMISQKL